MAFEKEFKIEPDRESVFFSRFFNDAEFENNIYNALSEKYGDERIKKVSLTVDTKKYDPRPLDINTKAKMKIFDVQKKKIEEMKVYEWIKDLPLKIIFLRVYTNSKEYIKDISEISNSLISEIDSAFTTNI